MDIIDQIEEKTNKQRVIDLTWEYFDKHTESRSICPDPQGMFDYLRRHGFAIMEVGNGHGDYPRCL